jgi:predicted NodU family carbamoyl transferase
MGLVGYETSSVIQINKNFKIKSLLKKARYYPINSGIGRGVGFNFSSLGLTGLAKKDKVHTVNDLFKDCSFEFDLSNHIDVGQMYDTITNHIGFGPNGHGKTMGLSAYGKPNENVPSFFVEGTKRTNMNLFTSGSELNYSLYPHLFDENNLNFQFKADLAYAAQKATEEMFLDKADFIMKNTHIRNLIICGGCGLNILAVSKIKEKYPEFNIFVDPISNDAVHSIGHGISAYNNFFLNGELEKKNHFNSIYLGPKYSNESMIKDIEKFMESEHG